MTLPEGYRANGMFDKAVTYNVIYKGDWYSYSPIIQKYRIENLLEANCEGKEYGINIDIKNLFWVTVLLQMPAMLHLREFRQTQRWCRCNGWDLTANQWEHMINLK